MSRALTPFSSGALSPWDVRGPRWFDSLRREMDQLFNQFLAGAEDGGEQLQMFAPRTNVAKTDKNYEISVDLPGLKPEEFNVELKEGHLWITGERKQEAEEHGKTYHRVERMYGQFRRVIPLGMDVDPEKVAADKKAPVEDAIQKLKDALAGDDIERIKREQETLTEAMRSVAEELYAQPEADAADTAGGATTEGADASGQPGGSADDDVIDADFTMDDDKK